jgi:hypothetical protein
VQHPRRFISHLILFHGIIDIDGFMALIQIQRAASSVDFCGDPGIGPSVSEGAKYGYLLDPLDLKLIVQGVVALINIVVQVLINDLLGKFLEVPRSLCKRGL